MKKKNIVLAAAIVILVGVTAAGTYVSIQNYKKAETARLEQQTDNKNQSGENDKAENESSENTSQNEDAAQKEDKKEDGADSAIENKTPVFMYFVSESDSDYDKALEVFDELKKQYGDRVEFQLNNVTNDPSLLERFSLVDGNTPALIMDGKELGLQFKTTDKNVLSAEIEKMLNK